MPVAVNASPTLRMAREIAARTQLKQMAAPDHTRVSAEFTWTHATTREARGDRVETTVRATLATGAMIAAPFTLFFVPGNSTVLHADLGEWAPASHPA